MKEYFKSYIYIISIHHTGMPKKILFNTVDPSYDNKKKQTQVHYKTQLSLLIKKIIIILIISIQVYLNH